MNRVRSLNSLCQQCQNLKFTVRWCCSSGDLVKMFKIFPGTAAWQCISLAFIVCHKVAKWEFKGARREATNASFQASSASVRRKGARHEAKVQASARASVETLPESGLVLGKGAPGAGTNKLKIFVGFSREIAVVLVLVRCLVSSRQGRPRRRDKQIENIWRIF